jgi:hypothetical protein
MGWDGISSYVDKHLSTMPEVLAPVVNELVIILNKQGQIYWPVPSPPVNQIGNWSSTGYKVKFKSSACLPVYGDTLNDQNFQISGSNTYLPVLTNVPTNIAILLGSNRSNTLLIFDWHTGEIWTNTAADFQYLLPGKAYMLLSKTSTTNYTVSFPDFDPDIAQTASVKSQAKPLLNHSPWNDIANTSQPHFILFSDEVIDGILEDDIIGAFDSYNNCVGMAEFNNSDKIYKLLIMGDDPMTQEIDGCQPNEGLTFKLFRLSTSETFDITLNYNPDYPSSDGLFTINGVSMVEGIMMNITSINETSYENRIRVLPNPAKNVLNIKSEIEIKGIMLINYLGQKIIYQTENNSNFQFNVSDFDPGVYLIKFDTFDGNTIFKRVSIQ